MTTLHLKWQHDLHQGGASILPNGSDSFLVSERERYISEIDALTGEPRWAQRVFNAWGYFALSDPFRFYMEQDDIVRRYDSSGNMLGCILFPASVVRGGPLRYVRVQQDVLITGGWRGYSDMVSYCLRKSKIVSSRDFRMRNL
jgi:hypothetical protein